MVRIYHRNITVSQSKYTKKQRKKRRIFVKDQIITYIYVNFLNVFKHNPFISTKVHILVCGVRKMIFGNDVCTRNDDEVNTYHWNNDLHCEDTCLFSSDAGFGFNCSSFRLL